MATDKEAYVAGFTRALDSKFHDDFGLDQTPEYWDMLKTMATIAVDNREKCIEQNKYDLGDFYESLQNLTMDDIGIPNEYACKNMFNSFENRFVWNMTYDSLKDEKSYRKKLWLYWKKEGLDYLSVLMNC